MAKVRFEKGSFYWRVFAEYYILCQDYWELKDTDEWWEELNGRCEEFIAKYDNSMFARDLCSVLVRRLENMKKGVHTP